MVLIEAQCSGVNIIMNETIDSATQVVNNICTALPLDKTKWIDYIKKVANIDTYTVREHQRILQKRFNDLYNEKIIDKEGKEKNKYFISNKIKNLILVYLTGKNYKGERKEWSSDNIEMNWANEELLAWSDDHPDCVPHPNGTLKNKQKRLGIKCPAFYI